jgi:hypothetical protein
MRQSKRDITNVMKGTGYRASEEIKIRPTTMRLHSDVMSFKMMILLKFKVKKKIGIRTKNNAIMKSSGFLTRTNMEHGKNKRLKMQKYGTLLERRFASII